MRGYDRDGLSGCIRDLPSAALRVRHSQPDLKSN